MSIQLELLNHLRDHVPERVALATHLAGDSSRVHCYYICPFSTLQRILADGIKCRNSRPQAIDLSSSDVQSRRKTVWLGRSDGDGNLRRMRDVPIHSCINFFWNPLNRTFEAFQRNGLLRAAETNDHEHGIVCLLEIDVERLLDQPGVYWTATNKNAASGGFASFEMKYAAQFTWPNTYALGPYSQERPWQTRAAELIVYIHQAGNQHSAPVPPSSISRVLLPGNVQLAQQQEQRLSSSGLRISRPDVFKSLADLLKSEKMFISNLQAYRSADADCVKRAVAAFRLAIEFESRFGGPSTERFKTPAIAHSKHGVGHVTRVIFWTAFLATYAYGTGTTGWHTAAMLAALLHDLSRENDLAEQTHGAKSLEENRALIGKALHDKAQQDSCANAVQMHGVPDDECPLELRDPIWQILKDADGLERGRFARPDRQGGCNPSMLRLNYMPSANAFRKTGPWLAYQLEGITKNSQWDRRPCSRLFTDFSSGLMVAVDKNVISPEHMGVARDLLTQLTQLSGEVEMQGLHGDPGIPYEVDDDYADFDDRGEEDEEESFVSEQEHEWEEWLESDEDYDWDDHDLDSDDFDYDPD